MTFARVRRPTCEARSAARKASPSTYTPPWKYRATWRGSIPSTVISAVGTPPSAAAVTVTPAGSGCAEASSLSSRRCSLTSLPNGKADCRRIASRFSRCSVLTEDFLRLGWFGSAQGLRRLCLPVPDGAVGQDVAVGAPPLDLAPLELLLVQRRVHAALAQQGAVGTGFHHAPGVDDIDDVGVDDGGQAMGDGDGGP